MAVFRASPERLQLVVGMCFMGTEANIPAFSTEEFAWSDVYATSLPLMSASVRWGSIFWSFLTVRSLAARRPTKVDSLAVP